MNILVTGGAGYLGSRVSEYLLRRGHAVTVLDRLDYGADALIHLFDHPGFAMVSGDVRDASPAGTFDAVVHLAAIVGDPACGRDPAVARSVNVGGTQAVLERFGTDRFVLASTCSNYGVTGRGEIANEETALNPLSAYAETKIEAEALARDAGGTVLRFATLCGLSLRMRFDLLVNDIARAAAANRELEIYRPDAWRPYLHVRDCARAICHVVEAGDMGGRTFNVVGENYTKRELAAMARSLCPKASIQITEGNGSDLRDYRVSGALFMGTGFTALHRVENAMAEVLAAARTMADPWRESYCNAA